MCIYIYIHTCIYAHIGDAALRQVRRGLPPVVLPATAPEGLLHSALVLLRLLVIE